MTGLDQREGTLPCWWERALFDRSFVALAPLALLLMAGCPSLSTMQTPATVPAGKARFGVALGIGAAQKDFTSATSHKPSPPLEISGRLGITDHFDLGAKLYLVGLEIGCKYQFVKGDFEAAFAPAVNFNRYPGILYEEKESAKYLHLPLLLGYWLGDSVELAFGPRGLYMSLSESMASRSTTSTGFAAGGYMSIQFRVSDAVWIAPEINAYRPLAGEMARVSWHGGVAFLFGGAAPSATGPP